MIHTFMTSDFLSILDEISDLVFFLTPELDFIWANRAYIEHMGLNADITGMNISEVVPEDYSGALRQKFTGISPENPFSDNIYPSMTEDGGIIIEKWHNEGHFINDKLLYYHCTASLENQRRSSESAENPAVITDKLIKTVLVGLVMAQDGRVYYINRKFHELTGLPFFDTLDKLSMTELLERVFPGSAAELTDSSSLNPVEFEKEIHTKSGGLIWLSVSRKFEKINNSIYEMLIIEDISDAKLAIIEADKARNIASYLMQTAKIGYWEKDYHNQCWIWSDETYSIFDMDPALTITEKTLEEYIDPDYMRERRIKINQAESADQSTSYSYEYLIKTKPGNQKWISGISFFEKANSAEETRFYGWVQDITDRKQNEEALRRAKEKAEESERLKTAFLANMSHEIRTPLNAILGFSDLLAGSNSPGEKEKFIGIINQSSNILLKIVDDILDFSLIESGTFDMDLQVFDVNRVLSEIEKMFSGSEKRDIRFIIREYNEKLPVKADRERLKQVIINLVNNAFKYTMRGSITLTAAPAENSRIRISVLDTGMGIAEEHLPLIFNRFYQIDSFSKGTGLGLSISRALIEQMGGSMEVQSVKGRGSEFSFLLPAG